MRQDGIGYLAILLSSRLAIYLSSRNQLINQSNQSKVYVSIYQSNLCICHHMSIFLSFFLANPFIYLFYLYLSAYMYICLSIIIYLRTLSLSLHISISLSTCLSICLTIYVYIYLPLSHGSIFLSTYPSIHRSSIYLLISQFYLSVHLSEYTYPSINLHSKIQ